MESFWIVDQVVVHTVTVLSVNSVSPGGVLAMAVGALHVRTLKLIQEGIELLTGLKPVEICFNRFVLGHCLLFV